MYLCVYVSPIFDLTKLYIFKHNIEVCSKNISIYPQIFCTFFNLFENFRYSNIMITPTNTYVFVLLPSIYLQSSGNVLMAK